MRLFWPCEMPDTNYSSGDDYIVEFLGYRFTFNACDFEQRVVAAASKLGLVEANELEPDETSDLVALAAQGVIDDPESRLGRYLARNWERVALVGGRVARLLAAQARLPRRLARPPGEARRPRGRLGGERGRVRLPAPRRAAAPARARAGSVVARAAVQGIAWGKSAGKPGSRREPPCKGRLVARRRLASRRAEPGSGVERDARSPGKATALAAYLAGAARARPFRLLARAARARGADLGRAARARSRGFPLERRAQALGVVLLRDDRRAHRLDPLGRLPLPAAQPAALHPARARARVPDRALARGRRSGATLALLVAVAAAVAAASWGLLGLTVLPRRDVAGAIGVPLLLLFLWRSRNRAALRGVFLVVAALELYGTAIGTWRWAAELPGLGIPDGNPPSGVASGYVWFDVMALLVAAAARAPLVGFGGLAAQKSVEASRAAPACVAAELGDRCGRAACAGGTRAAAGTARRRPRSSRPPRRARPRASRGRPGRRRTSRRSRAAGRGRSARGPDSSISSSSSASSAISVVITPGMAHLGDVADAAEDPVRDPRRSARPAGDLVGGIAVDVDAEDPRAPADDRAELGGRVEVEPEREAEAVAQRRRQQAGARRRADERERRQVERQRARGGPLADDDVEPEVLERRVEDLLDRPVQPVDLVDEEHVVRLERGQDRRDVALALERGAGDLPDRRRRARAG